MTKRENLIRALRRQKPESVPFYFSLCPSLVETFKTKTGSDNYLDYFEIPIRFANILPSRQPADYSPYYSELPPGAVINEWGVAHTPGSMEHFTKMLHPMENFTSVEEIQHFPLPDVLAGYRWEGVAEQVRKIREKGLATVYYAVQIFEPAWYLRGMDNLLVDMAINEELAKACLDRLTPVKSEIAARMAKAGVDMIIYGDDVGSQREMIMNPAMWRQWLKPALSTAIRAAKDVNPDIICYYHSDGVIEQIIPDLIEIGVDVLNPVQPECMDPVKLKSLYGDRLSFWGTVGTQTTMPFGTPQEVEMTVKRMIETVGKGGGLVIAPTHLLEPEVPWENITALVTAVKKYGQYD